MNLEPRIDIIADALADQTRACFVCTLMDGRAFTAKELAHGAGVTPQTASFHLRILLDRGLITVVKSGRSKYHRIANPDVAAAVESLAVLTSADHLGRVGPRRAPETVLLARTCYDHLAGRLATQIADRLVQKHVIEISDGAFRVTAGGGEFFRRLGIDYDALTRLRRPLVRCCIDWTERRFHAAGGIGAAMLDEFLAQGWLQRRQDSRALDVTAAGFTAFERNFGIERTALTAAERPDSLRLSA